MKYHDVRQQHDDFNARLLSIKLYVSPSDNKHKAHKKNFIFEFKKATAYS